MTGDGPVRGAGLELIRVIAAREFNTRIRSRSFAITTLLLVVGLAGYIVLQAYVFNRPNTIKVGFAGDAQAIASPVRSAAAKLGVTVTVDLLATTSEGKSQVGSGTLDAMVSGPPATTTVTVKTDLDPTLQTVLNDVLRQDVLSASLTKRGVDPAAVEREVAATAVHVDALSPVNAVRVQEIVIGVLVAGTLYVSLLIYGQLVAAGVVEEKANRIVEILLTAVRPWQLLLGKVTGIGLVGLVQLLVAAAVALVVASITRLVSIPTLGVDVIAGGVVWFVLGYVEYALVFAGAASLVSRQEEVATVTMPVLLIIVVAFLVAISVAAPNPGGTGTTVLSMIPPLAPMVMPVRMAAGDAPIWQVALSVVLTLVTNYALAALAGRVYRNSVLRVGGRVKLGEALKRS